MTIFASTPPINDDPLPWLASAERTGTDGRVATPQDGYLEEPLTIDPRPEFDRPRAHEANPVLVAFREREMPGGHTHIFAVRQWAAFTMWGSHEWDGSICAATDAEVRHAHRVFQRWRRIFDE